MKKEDAVESLERAGNTINDLYTRAWGTALYPTQNGWGPSIACIAAIPVLSLASLGPHDRHGGRSADPDRALRQAAHGKKPGEP